MTVSADAVAGDISIHALVKRATSFITSEYNDYIDFNPRPREEGDISPATATLSKGDFNPRPREEGDLSLFIGFNSVDISIHALVKRATSRAYLDRTYKRFQSTPS